MARPCESAAGDTELDAAEARLEQLAGSLGGEYDGYERPV